MSLLLGRTVGGKEVDRRLRARHTKLRARLTLIQRTDHNVEGICFRQPVEELLHSRLVLDHEDLQSGKIRVSIGCAGLSSNL